MRKPGSPAALWALPWRREVLSYAFVALPSREGGVFYWRWRAIRRNLAFR